MSGDSMEEARANADFDWEEMSDDGDAEEMGTRCVRESPTGV